jgi:hypothetical protein
MTNDGGDDDQDDVAHKKEREEREERERRIFSSPLSFVLSHTPHTPARLLPKKLFLCWYCAGGRLLGSSLETRER